MSRPKARGFWNRLLCGLGLHSRFFSFGWTEYLDNSNPPGYEGTFFCSRCGLILTHTRNGGEEGR